MRRESRSRVQSITAFSRSNRIFCVAPPVHFFYIKKLCRPPCCAYADHFRCLCGPIVRLNHLLAATKCERRIIRSAGVDFFFSRGGWGVAQTNRKRFFFSYQNEAVRWGGGLVRGAAKHILIRSLVDGKKEMKRQMDGINPGRPPPPFLPHFGTFFFLNGLLPASWKWGGFTSHKMTGTQGGSCVLETAASNSERLTGTTTKKKNESAVSIERELVAGSIFGGLLRRTREKKKWRNVDMPKGGGRRRRRRKKVVESIKSPAW